jgi:CheY-like chemotaxis protein
MGDAQPRARILVADDMQFFRMMLNELLTDQGFEVLEARNGDEATEVVRREHASLALVILDMVMPGKDGADVLREIRANPRTERLPVIIVTGQECTAEQREDLRAMGATGFLSKAVPSKEMLFRVRQLIDEHVRSGQSTAEGVQVNLMVDYLTTDGTFSALCYCLSERWLDLRTIRPLSVGVSVTMSFELPGGADPLQLRGQVIESRSAEGGATDGPPAGMRVQFVSPDPGVIAEIQGFIQGKPRRA